MACHFCFNKAIKILRGTCALIFLCGPPDAIIKQPSQRRILELGVTDSEQANYALDWSFCQTNINLHRTCACLDSHGSWCSL